MHREDEKPFDNRIDHLMAREADEGLLPVHDRGTPNLDGMWPDDLANFATGCYEPHEITTWAALFPAKPWTSYAKKVLHALGRYAAQKAIAMKMREAGRIHVALPLEGECDAIYKTLPKWARW